MRFPQDEFRATPPPLPRGRGTHLRRAQRQEARVYCGRGCTLTGPCGIGIIRGIPPIPAVDAAPLGAPATGDAEPATAAPADQTIFPKRDALWNVPCPRMGDHATPAFC